MRLRQPLTALTVASVLAMVALASAQIANAVFNQIAKGGPATFATSTLAAPTSLTTVQVNCRSKKTPELEVDWVATSSTYVASYSVERATSSNGTYTAVASVTAEQTVYTDKSALAYSTTYYYRVKAVYGSWTATSTVKSVKTLSSSCV